MWCKREVPCIQNFILIGNSKSRVTYHNLSMSQWVSSVSRIIAEETNIEAKNNMLDYLSDIIEDSHDFGWSSAKGCHAVLSVKMEEGKIDWSDIDKIDRVRRIPAQRSAQTQTFSASNKKTKTNQ